MNFEERTSRVIILIDKISSKFRESSRPTGTILEDTLGLAFQLEDMPTMS